MRSRFVLLLLSIGVLHAQDADLVLRTSVGYRTMMGTRPLSPEQKAEAEKLAAAARAASSAGEYGEAMRHYGHGTAVMLGQEWTPAVEFVASLQARVDHAVPAPGATLHLTLKAFYPTTRALAEPVTAALYLRRANEPPGAPLQPPVEVKPADLPLTISAPIPANISGDYALMVRLRSAGRDLPGRLIAVHIADFAPQVEALKKRLQTTTEPTAAYAIALYERADAGEVFPHRLDFPAEFVRANAILDDKAAGRDPYAGKTGEIRKAYRSPVDQTLQPYRLYIPTTYDASKPFPLVVALHGMGGNESSMLEGYEARLKQEVEKRGIIIAAPKGRAPASMYRGDAEKDVMDVLAEVRRDYKIDPKRIYLMGHSMGAFGTWTIAMNHPDLFAALGPIAGGGVPADLSKVKDIPHFIVHGDNDKTVDVERSRSMVAAAKALKIPLEYVEVPNGSHQDIVAPNFGPMLDFFLKHPKQ